MMEDNFDCDKDYAKCGGWMMSSKEYESKNMSGSSHSSDSHGVYSAYSAGNMRSSVRLVHCPLLSLVEVRPGSPLVFPPLLVP